MHALRPYQERAVAAVRAQWAAGARSVCLVAPTGAGKTVLGCTLASDAQRVVWVTHRRELVSQAAERLASELGADRVSTLDAGRRHAPVQVASVQALLARGARPPADLVVWDEVHHVAADSWRTFLDAYQSARWLGLTATPERGDGRPLGAVFGALVVAASYSELVADGFLVPAEVYQPPAVVGEPGEAALAADPLVAYQAHGAGRQCFGFARTIDQCEKLTEAFAAAGIPAATVSARTETRARRAALARFADGELSALWSVHALTEGVDVPAAAVALLARGFGHAGQYLQAVGRVLRPAPGKSLATVIDLVGSTLQHGMPTEDRVYSLDGEPIRRTAEASLRNCLRCGYVWETASRACPQCSWEPERREAPTVRIYSVELRRVFAGSETPSAAKATEWSRLRALATARGWSIGWCVRQYRRTFSEPAWRPADVTQDERASELALLLGLAAQKGYQPGWAAHRYRDLFGAWPPRQRQTFHVQQLSDG